ncbi:NUDIX hydrolase [Rudanella lutea]|uniref:NUDIX hydrolase n=1 Tax=Rudanella lutea TaxID=451374 RepID=UPI000399BF94|nr:NUDIX hydrolase [Rudanella lutea]
MHRQPLLTQLRRYQPTDPHERTMWLNTIAFVEENPDCFERSLSVGHVTGSAWIVAQNPTQPDRTQVVLIHHRKLDRWFQPGGHADGNPDILAVARQEAQEETGLTQLTALGSADDTPEIFDVDVHLIPARGTEPAHFHYDIRFLFRANPLEPFVQSGETKAICWVDLQDIIRYTTEESIERMVKKTKVLLCF